jgi:hypothetical protein
MIQEQLRDLVLHCTAKGLQAPENVRMPSGGVLIRIPAVPVQGWNRNAADILFVAPPGYPAAQPDCFWIEPAGFRLVNGGTPQNTNDANPIPGDVQAGRSTTWFSWHLQGWNPSRDSLKTYFGVILNRLTPAR